MFIADWIDIDLQQPECGQKVLVYVAEYDEITTAYFVKLGDGGMLFYNGFGYSYYFNEEDNITDWMPLPEKPKRHNSEHCEPFILEMQND